MQTSSDDRLSEPKTANSRDWYLVGAMSKGQRIRDADISRSSFRVGRHASCDLQLHWPSVSSRHAEFALTSDGLMLRDLGSTNGTFVNGTRITSETPVFEEDVVQLGAAEFRICCRPPIERSLPMTMQLNLVPSMLLAFEELISGQSLVPNYQPVVRIDDGSTIGFEVLARSRDPHFQTPYQMFETAEQLGAESALSEVCRTVGVRGSEGMPLDQILFLNTHPAELRDGNLIQSLETLRSVAPDQAMSLEIHEAAVTDLHAMAELLKQLRDLEIDLAYDDFGAGQARMLDLVEVPPDILKFDMSLIRNIHRASAMRHKMVQTMVSMVKDFGIAPLAEGIETPEEAETCEILGFELAQGYYYGRPAEEWRNS